MPESFTIIEQRGCADLNVGNILFYSCFEKMRATGLIHLLYSIRLVEISLAAKFLGSFSCGRRILTLLRFLCFFSSLCKGNPFDANPFVVSPNVLVVLIAR